MRTELSDWFGAEKVGAFETFRAQVGVAGASSNITEEVDFGIAPSLPANCSRKKMVTAEISRSIESLCLPPETGRIGELAENAFLESRVELPPIENIRVISAELHGARFPPLLRWTAFEFTDHCIRFKKS
jgi:hypothetical protein